MTKWAHPRTGIAHFGPEQAQFGLEKYFKTWMDRPGSAEVCAYSGLRGPKTFCVSSEYSFLAVQAALALV